MRPHPQAVGIRRCGVVLATHDAGRPDQFTWACHRRRSLATDQGMPSHPTVTWLRRELRETAAAVLDAACPPHCPGCGAATAGLCGPCRAGLEWRPAAGCPRCGAPVLGAVSCGDDHRALRGLAWARAPLHFRGTGGMLVRRFKFQRDPEAARLLYSAMTSALAPWARGPGRRAVLVSVPLHRRKRRHRGGDQAAQLAQGVAQRAGLRFCPRVLLRCRDTAPQGDPRVTSRSRNVEGAFAVRRPRAVRGRMVVLVDDVRTSGATARACAALLTAAGASSVGLLTAAVARG